MTDDDHRQRQINEQNNKKEIKLLLFNINEK